MRNLFRSIQFYKEIIFLFMPIISIVIPVKNGISTIQQCLNAIYSQSLIQATEVIIIDSGSTDGTLDIVNNYPVRLYKIKPHEFNHGTTRNYGVTLAKGEFIVMTVQDAIPTSVKWLEHLISPFKDKNILGVCGRQMIPHDANKNPGVWTETYSIPEFRKAAYSLDELPTMTPEQKKKSFGWDNVTAAYRKDTLVEFPFPATNYSEDIHWAYSMFLRGKTLGYAPLSSVWHYHHETFSYRFKRRFIEHTQYNNLYGLKTSFIISKKDLIPIYTLCKNNCSIRWLGYNLKILIANKCADTVLGIIYFFKLKRFHINLYKKVTKEVPIGRYTK